MRRRGVEIEILLLHIFAVVSLFPGETKETLFEDRVLAVPEGQRETKAAFPVGDAKQPVFAPTIGPAPGVIVREMSPAVTPFGVIFADSGPLPFTQIRTPPLPVPGACGVFVQARL